MTPLLPKSKREALVEPWILGVVLALVSWPVGSILIILGLPGTWFVCIIALAFAFWTNFAVLGWPALVAMIALAALGEWLEFWLGASAAAKVRPSWKVTIGAVVGGFLGALLGAPFLFGIGALIGSVFGSFAGAAAAAYWEGASLREVLEVGRAAMKGRWQGFLAKMIVMVLIGGVFLGAALS